MQEEWNSQTFVSASLEELDQEGKDALNAEMNEIDVNRVANIFKRCTSSTTETSAKYEPLDTVLKVDSQAQYLSWESVGLEQIRNNKVAVVLLAGGQGSRLGYNHPKGMFDFGLPSHKSLFQIQAERIQNLQQRAARNESTSEQIQIPWYIMTSDATYDETLSFFNENDFFGLDRNNVRFFNQSKLPATDTNGQILLASPSKIFQAPDGNGGVYAALLRSENISDMEQRGVETIFMYGVDNALVRVADPVFIGSFLDSKTKCGAKSVPKAYPEERVGILCKKDGIVQVIEYSEISEEMANERTEDGSLRFNTGNIVTHIFTFSCLQDICKRAEEMPYHLAKKQVTVYNPETKSYDMVWAYKYEQFVFDAFQLISSVFALEVIRSEEFTAIKNKEGKDSPDSALNDVITYHRSLLEKAGATITAPGLVEISPLISYAGENLNFLSGKSFNPPVLI